MSYEDAPATKMLATHCAACGKDLVDAASVEAGLGPVCRKSYLPPEGVSEEERAKANHAVYRLALHASGKSPDVDVVEELKTLVACGFAKVAKRVLDRLCSVWIAEDSGYLWVKSPFVGSEYLREVPGRRWIKDRKTNRFPLGSRTALWATLQKAYPGLLAVGPKGPFIIGAPAQGDGGTKVALQVAA